MHKQAIIGSGILLPLIVSMIFIGATTNATQNSNLGLDQSEATSVSKASIWLYLTIDGNDIQGDSQVQSLDREGTIEIWSFRMDVQVPSDVSSGRATGSRVYSPIIVTKLIDRSSPLLMKALTHNEQVDEAEFKFFRTSVNGEGSEEYYYSIKIELGRITGIRVFTLTDFSTHAVYDMEEISFSFQRITVTYVDGGVENVDDIRNRG